jgi:glycosyltransferase involved in cell wall biosynthesis
MSSEQRQHILMISDQDMLRAGNQVLYQTIRGYVAAGFHVTFVTDEKDDSNVATSEELFGPEAESVEIRRFRITFHTWRQRLIGQGWLRRLRGVRGWLRRGATGQGAPFPPRPEEVLPFTATFEDASAVLNRLAALLFDRSAYATCMEVAGKRHVDMVYGFEVMAAPIARKVATQLGVPLCTRFQGSFLKHALDDGTAKQIYPLHLSGTAVESDLCVMSNDGTNGVEVLLRLGHPPERVLFLLDGMRKDIYRPEVNPASVWAEYGIHVKESTRILLTLSKLSPWKRLDRIIGAMPAILQEIPDTYLVIAHRGPMRSQLEQYARELGVAGHVVFTGPVPNSQVYRLLNACDIYVNCSDQSNLSNPVMEALVCCKPVVSIDDGSLDGVITSGQNGVLVSLPRIRDELPVRLSTLLKGDAQMAEMSRNARSFAAANLHTWEERMAVEVGRVEQLLRPMVAG